MKLDIIKRYRWVYELQVGFTLIELLIVIAILGILATSVLVALDPVEQMNRGRDAGKINSISQLGKAAQAYYTVQGAYQTANVFANNVNWQQALLTAGEIKQRVVVGSPTSGNCGWNVQGNICYWSNGQEALIWTALDAKANRVKAGNCAAGSYIAAAWISSQGKAGIACLTNMNVLPLTQQLY